MIHLGVACHMPSAAHNMPCSSCHTFCVTTPHDTAAHVGQRQLRHDLTDSAPLTHRTSQRAMHHRPRLYLAHPACTVCNVTTIHPPGCYDVAGVPSSGNRFTCIAAYCGTISRMSHRSAHTQRKASVAYSAEWHTNRRTLCSTSEATSCFVTPCQLKHCFSRFSTSSNPRSGTEFGHQTSCAVHHCAGNIV